MPCEYHLEKGAEFGRWTLTGENRVVRTPGGYGIKQWEAVCSCERKTVSWIATTVLRRGKSVSCGCRSFEALMKERKETNGQYKEIGWTFWKNDVERSAKRRGIEFNMTIQEGWELLESQCFTCPYTNRPLNMGKGPTNKGRNASLDRIGSHIPYDKGNCEWVYLPLNKMKMSLSKERFIQICSAVAKNYNRQLVELKELEVIPSITVWRKMKYSAEYSGRKYEISYEYAMELLRKQGSKCALSGETIYFPDNAKDYLLRTASLDRIDPTKGYVEGNVQWLLTDVNLMKRDHMQDYYISLCKEIDHVCGYLVA